MHLYIKSYLLDVSGDIPVNLQFSEAVDEEYVVC